jgi:predicted N-acyltransferase
VGYEVRIEPRLASVPRPAWDALTAGDSEASPFTSWAWLTALEQGGAATPHTGWSPRHLLAYRGRELVAAAPAYSVTSSEGDFARDWGWADGALRAGIRYYPKLVLTVPFTPVGGRRLLVAAGEPRAEAVPALVEAAWRLVESERLGCVQVLYPLASEALELEACGLSRRLDFQYHWHNRGYRSYDDWLAELPSKRRNQARRERAAPARQGIAIRTVRGPEIAQGGEDWARTVDAFYRATIDRMVWGRGYLTRSFYQRVFSTMPEHLEVVTATREGRLVAGAFNVSSATRLYGRYWGCHEEHPFLHFNVCLYHSIADCIERGLSVFEGGAGGEHKGWRGFEPTETWSAHRFRDARLDEAVRDHLLAERTARQEALRRFREGSG